MQIYIQFLQSRISPDHFAHQNLVIPSILSADIEGRQLNLAEDVFKLQHLLECNILAHREDIEEIAAAAVKEEQIETKLAVIENDWAQTVLSFAEYKTRGPVILKSSDTAELIEKLEDSQMTLGSMATNRSFNTSFMVISATSMCFSTT